MLCCAFRARGFCFLNFVKKRFTFVLCCAFAWAVHDAWYFDVLFFFSFKANRHARLFYYFLSVFLDFVKKCFALVVCCAFAWTGHDV